MATVKKPYARSVSFGSVFKRRKNNPYQTWEDEDDTDGVAGAEISLLVDRETGTTFEDQAMERHCSSPLLKEGEIKIADGYFLGSVSMGDLPIKGRGCIDTPVAKLWEEHAQVKRRHYHAPSRDEGAEQKLKYIRLVASKEELLILDYTTSEIMARFDYRVISFTGTHPKHTSVFAFVAQTKDEGPFCFAFKCADGDSATQAACELANVFQRRCTELVRAVSLQQGSTLASGTATLVQ